MSKYYQITLGFNKENEMGEMKKINENYLVDALNYTEAEAKAYRIGEETVRGEFHVVEIKKTKIIDVFLQDNEAPFFKAKIEYYVTDNQGREKPVKQEFLVSASNFGDAFESLKSNLVKFLVPYKVVGFNEVNLVEVFEAEAVSA